MQFFKKSSSRFKHLKIAQNYTKTKEDTKKERLRNYLDREILLSNIPWSEEEFKLLVRILCNIDNSIPENTLLQMVRTNPQSLVKILFQDIIKITGTENTRHESTHFLTIDEKLQGRTKTPFGVRVALIGDSNVGKQTIANKFLGKKYESIEYSTLFHQVKTGIQITEYTFQFRRLAPLDTFIEIRTRFYRNAMVGLVIFDISNPVSFLNAIKWIEELWTNSGRKLMPIALIGNKSDLRSVYDVNHIPVDKETITHYCQDLELKIGFQIPYIEISAKENKNKREVLSHLIKVFQYQELLNSFSPIQRTQNYFEAFVVEKFMETKSGLLNLDKLFQFLTNKTLELKSEYNIY